MTVAAVSSLLKGRGIKNTKQIGRGQLPDLTRFNQEQMLQLKR
jgi:hypothetical protein